MRAGLALLSRAGRGLLEVGVHRSALGSSLPVVGRREANEGQLLLTPPVAGVACGSALQATGRL